MGSPPPTASADGGRGVHPSVGSPTPGVSGGQGTSINLQKASKVLATVDRVGGDTNLSPRNLEVGHLPWVLWLANHGPPSSLEVTGLLTPLAYEVPPGT